MDSKIEFKMACFVLWLRHLNKYISVEEAVQGYSGLPDAFSYKMTPEEVVFAINHLVDEGIFISKLDATGIRWVTYNNSY